MAYDLFREVPNSEGEAPSLVALALGVGPHLDDCEHAGVADYKRHAGLQESDPHSFVHRKVLMLYSLVTQQAHRSSTGCPSVCAHIIKLL